MTGIERPDPEWEDLLDRAKNDPESVAGYRAVTKRDATRALRQLARLDAEADAVDATVREEMAALNEWAAEEHRKQERKRAWIAGVLRTYHEACLAEDPTGAITIELPTGRLESLMGQPSWAYLDEAAFMAWAKEHAPELVRPGKPTKDAPDKNAVKKALVVKDGKAYTDEGVEVPGIEVAPAERSYTPVPFKGPSTGGAL